MRQGRKSAGEDGERKSSEENRNRKRGVCVKRKKGSERKTDENC